MSEDMPIKTKRIRQLLAIVIPCVIGWFFSIMAIYYFKDYTFGLFIWLPAVIGALSPTIHCSNNVSFSFTSYMAYEGLLGDQFILFGRNLLRVAEVLMSVLTK
jgi:hypothetical protein